MREYIQSKLDEIDDLDSGEPIADDVVEEGKTYFGYDLQETYIDSDYDNNYTMQVNLTGRLVRKINPTENTLAIVDSVLSELKEKFKEINFKYGYQDVTLDNRIKKIVVTAEGIYNEINKKFIR
ncbi:MAG: hypothetical protein IJI98_03280 [Methanosphaera sp.]|nr:hypothetical protein [Methanosphaera sp.]